MLGLLILSLKFYIARQDMALPVLRDSFSSVLLMSRPAKCTGWILIQVAGTHPSRGLTFKFPSPESFSVLVADAPQSK